MGEFEYIRDVVYNNIIYSRSYSSVLLLSVVLSCESSHSCFSFICMREYILMFCLYPQNLLTIRFAICSCASRNAAIIFTGNLFVQMFLKLSKFSRPPTASLCLCDCSTLHIHIVIVALVFCWGKQ